MTQADIEQVISELLSRGLDITGLDSAQSLDGISTFPAIQTTANGKAIVAVPISLLTQAIQTVIDNAQSATAAAQSAAAGWAAAANKMGSDLVVIEGDITTLQNADKSLTALTSYAECPTAANVAAKAVTIADFALPTNGGCWHIKMTNANTAALGVKLNINQTGSKPLYYNGKAVSATNSWKDGEVIEVFFDGTNYQASNTQGGGVDFEGVNDITTISDSANKIKLKDKDGSDAFPVSHSDAVKMAGEEKTLTEKMGEVNNFLHELSLPLTNSNEYQRRTINIDGSYGVSSTAYAYTYDFVIKGGKNYNLGTYCPASGSNLAYAFYDADNNYIADSGSCPNPGNIWTGIVSAPSTAVKVSVFGRTDKILPSLSMIGFSIANNVRKKDFSLITSDVLFNSLLVEIDNGIGKSFKGKKINASDGSIDEGSLQGGYVLELPIVANHTYVVHGVAPGNNNALMFGLYDDNDVFIEGINPNDSSAVKVMSYVLYELPQNVKKIKTFGSSTLTDANVSLFSLGAVPALYNSSTLKPNGDYALKNSALFELLATEIESDRRIEKYRINSDGSLEPSPTLTAYVNIYKNIDASAKYLITGYSPSSSDHLLCGFYRTNEQNEEVFLGGISISDTKSNETKTYLIKNLPTGTSIIKVFGIGENPALDVVQDAALFAIGYSKKTDSLPIGSDILVPVEVFYAKAISTDGTFPSASTAGARVSKYTVNSGEKYLVNGYGPSDNSTNCSIMCKDTNNNVLEWHKPTKSSAFIDLMLIIPEGCTDVYVFGNDVQPPLLKKYPVNEETIKINSIPQIYNHIDYHPIKNNQLRILCFGSSWFMCTWWYLNKLLGAADVSCELHCYYMGHAKMREWLAFYNGELTPFDGDEVGRGARKCISINGTNWTQSTYSASGSYTANQYATDFVNDLKNGDWDIIAFQQGAQECIIESEWAVKREVVAMIKENCSPRTKIAFNATFTPANDYSGSYFPTISRTEDGKWYFQQLNNKYTRLFMADTGIYDVSPNGAMLSLMRADDSLNTSDSDNPHDLTYDRLHPNNGLPNLGICGCFYETFIAPLINVTFNNLNWIPTTDTQKCPVSGSGFQSCTAEQLATIKKYVKRALSDRFKYYQK